MRIGCPFAAQEPDAFGRRLSAFSEMELYLRQAEEEIGRAFQQLQREEEADERHQVSHHQNGNSCSSSSNLLKPVAHRTPDSNGENGDFALLHGRLVHTNNDIIRKIRHFERNSGHQVALAPRTNRSPKGGTCNIEHRALVPPKVPRMDLNKINNNSHPGNIEEGRLNAQPLRSQAGLPITGKHLDVAIDPAVNNRSINNVGMPPCLPISSQQRCRGGLSARNLPDDFWPSSRRAACGGRKVQKSPERSPSKQSAQEATLKSWGSAIDCRLDFSNPDSVTRWTSQILAELETIPDLSAQCVDESRVPTEVKRSLDDALVELQDVERSICSSMSNTLSRSRDTTPSPSSALSVPVQRAKDTMLSETGSADRVNTWPLSEGRAQTTDVAMSSPDVSHNTSTDRAANGAAFSEDHTPTPSRNQTPSTSPVFKRVHVTSLDLNGAVAPETRVSAFKPYVRPTSGSDVAAPPPCRRRNRQQKRIPTPGLMVDAATDAADLDYLLSPTDSLMAQEEPATVQWRGGAESAFKRLEPTRRSVHGVVASIIRQAESTLDPGLRQVTTRSVQLSMDDLGDADDLFALDATDACTQTSPLSLSRSSSFTWVSEAELEQFESPTNRASYRASRTSTGAQADVPLAMESSESDEDESHLIVDEQRMSISVRLTPKDLATAAGEGFVPPPAGAKLRNSYAARQTQQRHGADSLTAPVGAIPPIAQPRMSKANNNNDNVLATDISIASAFRQARGANDLGNGLSEPCALSQQADQRETTQSARSNVLAVAKFNSAATTATGAVSPRNMMQQQAQALPMRVDSLDEDETIYDNVPLAKAQANKLRRAVDGRCGAFCAASRSMQHLPLSPDISSPLSSFVTPSLVKYPTSSMARDELSNFSGMFADSESSPMSPDQDGFAILNSSDLTQCTPDSMRSFPSTEGSFEMRETPAGELRSSYSNRLTNDLKQQGLANSLPTLDRISPPQATPSVSPRDQSIGSESNLNSQTSDSGFSSARERAEIEARECCRWLRLAGFPQYARMYEEHRFPLDISSVQKDHEFLDNDSLQALFRRLHMLNRCATMKLDGVLRRMADDESDDEDNVALSHKWRFQRKSRTWSRVQPDAAEAATDSSSPRSLHRSAMASPGESRERARAARRWDVDDHESVPVGSNCVGYAHTMEDIEHSPQPARKLQRSSSERIKDRARQLVKRMELMRSKRRKGTERRDHSLPANGRNNTDMVISDPVLIAHVSASPPAMRMFKGTLPSNDARDLPNTQPNVPSPALTRSVHRVHHPNTDHSDVRRRGQVFLNTSSIRENLSMNASSPVASGDEVLSAYPGKFRVDNNSNIDKIFTPKLPSAEGTESPALARKAEPAPLILFNPTFDMHATTRQRSNSASLGTDSSPEIGRQATTLRVHVDVEPARGAGDEVPLPLTTPSSQQTLSSVDSSDAESPGYWERRDSGVGSSLSRSPTAPRGPRVRWHSFHRQHRQSLMAVKNSHVDSLSVTQLSTLQKFALLKLTALMEKYAPHSKGGFNLGVQKFLKKMKSPEVKHVKDGQVFGVSLSIIAQRTGQPLPQCILQAMRFLRQEAPKMVGIFRKPGVRSRIQKLKQMCEESGGDLVLLDANQAFDVADLVKQYFRELPEPLLTSKWSETFIGIHLYVPQHLRMEAMQKCVLLLPDENREVLQSLLYFLHDIASFADTNQMTAQNLAVCFAPGLFQLSPRVVASPQRRHKTITAGLPNERELHEAQAAQECFTQMVLQCRSLFTVPEDVMVKCDYAVTDEWQPVSLAQLCRSTSAGSPVPYMDSCVQALLKEHRDKWKGWMTEGSADGVEISSKKVLDGHPLKLWRCWVDVEAPPKEVLARVLRERDVWDIDIMKWKVVRKFGENCELFQYVCNDMPPHPTRDYLVLRLWQTELRELRGGCVLVECSVDAPDVPFLGGIRAICIVSRYLIEPCGSGRCRITHVCRIDTRGRSKTWYTKVFGSVCANFVAKIRDSFHQTAEGPETKV